MNVERKRLFFDIEVSPNIGFFWSSGNQVSVGYENIIHERAIICVCYKWESESKVHYLTWDKKQNDSMLLKKFIKVANEADELVGHNGDKFDIKWIRTRCLYHNIEMFPQYTTIDTLKFARSHFRFNSNRLDYIGKFIGKGEKIKTDYSLWKKIVLDKDPKALNYMVKYCQQDVRLLESVFNAMKNYLPHRTHYGMKHSYPKSSCTECGSENTTLNRKTITATGSIRRAYRCGDCGKYHSVTSKN